jgi:hypothetical protein
MTSTPELIEELVARAGPVRRLRPPVLRAAMWLAGALLVFLVLAVWHGVRPDLATQLGRPWFVAGFVAAALTGVLAAVAAFMLSLPDRARAWGVLPLPAALAWVSSVSIGCLTDWVRFDPAGFQWGDAAICFGLLLMSSVPPSVALYWMLRHAAPLRPSSAILTGALGVGALSACAMSLLHAFEASAMILLWNFGAALLVMATDALVARRLVLSAH